MWQKWTEPELATLRQQYTTAPIEVLAARLGRTVRAIESAGRRLGLRRWNRPEMLQQALEMARQGCNEEVIAAQLGVCAATVGKFRRAAGIDPPRLLARAAFANRYGLPADLHFRQVQICVALACGGVLSLRELQQRLGLRKAQLNCTRLKTTFMSDLVQRGLVAVVRRQPTMTRLPNLYMLSGAAMEMMAKGAA